MKQSNAPTRTGAQANYKSQRATVSNNPST